MDGRVLNEEMVVWVRHLLHNTTWEPDRQAAADLLATIIYLAENEGHLPAEAITPGGMAPPRPLNAHGEDIGAGATLEAVGASPGSGHGGAGARQESSHRPRLRLVPLEAGEAPPEPPSHPTGPHLLSVSINDDDDDDEPRIA